MFRTLLERLGLRTDEEDSANGESEDDGFVPSRLDASVLEAHGMGTGAAERELASIGQKAETLESERPDETRDPER
jgi:hypothetical protein